MGNSEKVEVEKSEVEKNKVEKNNFEFKKTQYLSLREEIKETKNRIFKLVGLGPSILPLNTKVLGSPLNMSDKNQSLQI